jgi:hypothetical protein
MRRIVVAIGVSVLIVALVLLFGGQPNPTRPSVPSGRASLAADLVGRRVRGRPLGG